MTPKRRSAANRKKVSVMSTRDVRAARTHSKHRSSAVAASHPERSGPTVAPNA
jgi:hypothetical protein